MCFICVSFVCHLLWFLDLVRDLIFRLGTNVIGFDYTFEFGKAIYDRIDHQTVEKIFSNDKTNEDNKDEDGEEKMLEASTEPRTRKSHIVVSWLITVTDLEFILDCTPTPGKGEKFEFLQPVLAYNIEQYLINSEHRINSILFRCDGGHKNINIPNNVIDKLLEKHQNGFICSMNALYHYDLKQFRNQVFVCFSFVFICIF